jgi:hypothetical protein
MSETQTLFNNGNGIFEFGSKGEETKRLPAGIYKAYRDGFGRMFFSTNTFETDKLLKLTQGPTNVILADIAQFMSPEVKQAFRDYELMYRRGILLFGPPGTGKTSVVIQIARDFASKYDGIVLSSFPYRELKTFIVNLRKNDPGRPVLILMEELDEQLYNYETEILGFLDGENSIDNFIALATTNNIDDIEDRIKNRPSRFARVLKIGPPDLAGRLAFLESRVLPQHKELVDVKKLAKDSEGFSIDHLKDLIISIFAFGLTPEEAIKKLDENPKDKKKRAR